jgi:lipopolysaccharide/colanic/teichoic acid biosynthesis glycosyltransferase
MELKARISGKQNKLEKLYAKHENIFPPKEFKALVKYERTRSDRNGSIFSVVVFETHLEGLDDLEEQLVKMSKFTRTIDCVGWDEDGHISVLLPDTMKEGAEIFGRKLVAEFEANKSGTLEFNIYSYPENWISNYGVAEIIPNKKEKTLNTIKSSIEQLFVDRIPVWKRILDVSGSALILVLTSPILLLLAIYIKLVSPGPVFFKQTRIGFKGMPFTFWKFRTMKYDNNQGFHGKHAQSFIKDGDVPMEKLDNFDPRIIPGGKVIRKSCLDELPQLWNVMKGDMSLVGPRPCIPYEAQEYLRWHTHRFDTLPGLSGLWQVSGKNKLTFKQMIRLDIAYCRNVSLVGDIIIILRTPVAILKMVFEAMLNKYNGSVEKPATMPVIRLTERKAQ